MAVTGKQAETGALSRRQRYRARLQAQGLVPVQVWVPEESRALVKHLAGLLRDGAPVPWQVLTDAKPEGETGMNLEELGESLQTLAPNEGFRFGTALDGEDEDKRLIVTIEDREEFPVTVSVDDEQVLCLVHLWGEDEVKADMKAELHAQLLNLNPRMPLSSFGCVEGHYVLFGALAADATVKDIMQEIETLSENTLEAIGALSDYLA